MRDLERFSTVARLVLADQHIPVGEANRFCWLQCRLDHHDWMDSDIVRLREMLPVRMHWLLQPPARE